jgi:hypothetical protein
LCEYDKLRREKSSVGHFLVFLYSIIMIAISLLLVFSPLVSVSPEYINGVLTASAILFGFRLVMIERKPKSERFLARYVKIGFVFSLGFLIATVISLYLSALSNSAGWSKLTLGMAR